MKLTEVVKSLNVVKSKNLKIQNRKTLFLIASNELFKFDDEFESL